MCGVIPAAGQCIMPAGVAHSAGARRKAPINPRGNQGLLQVNVASARVFTSEEDGSQGLRRAVPDKQK